MKQRKFYKREVKEEKRRKAREYWRMRYDGDPAWRELYNERNKQNYIKRNLILE